MKAVLPGRVPDFVGFGVHRSGSTWLSDHLGQHPDVWTPPPLLKEVHYFDELHVPTHNRWHETRVPSLVSMMQDLLARESTPESLERVRRLAELASADRDNDWYRSFFGLADPQTPCVGEITPAYSMLDAKGVAHLARVNPDVRVFIVFRNPAERIWSQIKLSLKATIAKDPTVLQDTERISKIASRKGVVARTLYRQALETLEEVFPPEQIHVSFYDKVALAPHEMLREIATHIGVDPAGLVLEGLHTRQHTSPPGDLPNWFRDACNKSYGSDMEWLAERFGSYPASWLD